MRRRISTALFVVPALCACALTASAQTRPARPNARPTPPPPAQPRPSTQGPRDDPNADLSITARVTADSVRFEKVPNPRVEFTGRPERVTVWESDRENLPPEVRPGVTYRNVGITLRITSVFADIDRIVAEALGEVPVRDEAQPAPAAPPSPPSQTPGGTTPGTPPRTAARPRIGGTRQ